MRSWNPFAGLPSDTQGGIVLLAAALCALALANSSFAPYYSAIGNFSEPSLLFIVNEGLMTLFFLVVGLEIRREISDGELNSFGKSVLPGVAALGGMIIPALVYFLITKDNSIAARGYGIPVATDIAFALALLSICGPRVPSSLRAFLIALAIFDDIGAILLIAIFYSTDLSGLWLLVSFMAIFAMLSMNRFKIDRAIFYLPLSLILWFAALKSGVHATIAGVIVAFLLPASALDLKHKLDPWVTFLVLPLFAFLNAGAAITSLSTQDLMTPITLGIVLGLLVGKPVGVFIATWICIRLKLSPKPGDASWLQILGTAVICGIGFTMSLFIGMLAFENQGQSYDIQVRIGVLVGSILSALLGFVILRFLSKARQVAP